jgi:hypothetical protein
MLPFFTDPYKDELLYSAFARYHFQSGNIDLKDTLRELFGKDSVIPNLEIGSNLSYLCQRIGNHYNANKLLQNHTIFPYYSPFLPEKRKQELISDICNSDATGVFTKIGIVAGSICKKVGIWYCPQCAKRELNQLGEVFIHREHQLQGVLLCPHDGAFLKKYPIDKLNTSRVAYIRFDENLMDFNLEYTDNAEWYKKHKDISVAAYFLLCNDLSGTSKKGILNKYKNLLYERELANAKLRVKQDELHESFVNYYGISFLMELQSLPDKKDEYNWLRVATRNVARTVHPLRHILLINYLTGNMSSFFAEIKKEFKPFGEGPWPCLNKASNHYLQPVIYTHTVTSDCKTGQPVATFSCQCGFVYSRRGPDKEFEDRYHFGRIKEFGSAWEERLRNFLYESKLSQNAIARELNCDPNTVKKYSQKLLVEKQNVSVLSKRNPSLIKKALLFKNREVIVFAIYSRLSRTETRIVFKKEYAYLYRHDKKWLFSILPSAQKSKGGNEHVDWVHRDENILFQLRTAYEMLLNLEKPIRITRTKLANQIRQSALIEHYPTKLPLSMAFIKAACESKRDYQIRRCKKIIEGKVKADKPIRVWELQREAGLKKEDLLEIKPFIEQWIKTIKGIAKDEQKNQTQILAV